MVIPIYRSTAIMNHCLGRLVNGLKLETLLAVLESAAVKKNQAYILKYEKKENPRTQPNGVKTENNFHPEF